MWLQPFVHRARLATPIDHLPRRASSSQYMMAIRLHWTTAIKYDSVGQTPRTRPAEAFGIEARDAVADLILNQKVTLTYGDVERDGYGRLIASVRTEEHDVATYLLENGLAHAFFIPPESLDTPKLLAAQQKHKQKVFGLWSISRSKRSAHDLLSCQRSGR